MQLNGFRILKICDKPQREVSEMGLRGDCIDPTLKKYIADPKARDLCAMELFDRIGVFCEQLMAKQPMVDTAIAIEEVVIRAIEEYIGSIGCDED